MFLPPIAYEGMLFSHLVTPTLNQKEQQKQVTL